MKKLCVDKYEFYSISWLPFVTKLVVESGPSVSVTYKGILLHCDNLHYEETEHFGHGCLLQLLA